MWLALASVLAGCQSAPAEAAADGLVGESGRLAAAWAEDAVLVSVSAYEISPGATLPFAASSDAAGEARWDGNRDGRPGDGRASAWAFTYASPQQAAERRFLLGADGTLLASFDDPAEGAPRRTLEGWTVSSVEAAQAIRLRPEWPQGDVVFQQLAMAEAGPLWFFHVPTPGGHAEATVDAQGATVTCLLIEPGSHLRQGGTASGQLSPLEPTATVAMVVLGEPGPLGVAVAGQAALPTEGIRIVLAGPGGEAEEFAWRFGEPAATHVVGRAAPGNWTATLELVAGTFAQYNLNWVSSDGPSCSRHR